MKILVAVDENWGIGKNNDLLIRIPADQKMFRQMTTGNVIVIGRKTLDSFPNGMPLKDRVNIVLTKSDRESKNGEVIVNSVEELLEELKNYTDKEIYVAGGGSIYKQLLPYCKTAYVTKIDRKYDADVCFPNLDEDAEWELAETSEEQIYFDTTYHFMKYERVQN